MVVVVANWGFGWYFIICIEYLLYCTFTLYPIHMVGMYSVREDRIQ